MSLATYLKQDIDNFLEELKAQNTKGTPIREEEFAMFTIEKDYAELTERAFDRNDTNSVEHMLKELQKQVDNELLETDLREKVGAVLHEIEDIILRRLGEVDSPSLHMEAQKIAAKRKQESVTKEERESIFTKGINAIKLFINKGEIEEAKLAYQRLVKDFKAYSYGPESEAWRKRIFASYESIKDAQIRIQKEKGNSAKKHKEKIEAIKEKISLVINGLGSLESSVLENNLVEIKQDIIAAHMSKEQGEAFLPILRTLVSKINFLKQSEIKEEMLRKKKEAETKEAEKKIAAEKILAENKEIAKHNEGNSTIVEDEKEVTLSEEEEYLYEAALTLQEKGELTKAGKLYKQLLKMNPQNIRADIRLKEVTGKK